jgi:hypothetical protein
LSILQTTLERKTLIEITLFSSFVVKTPKREKSYEAQKRNRLLIVLHLLVVVSMRLIIIIGRNTSRDNAESRQLGRSQRAIGVGDGREDRNAEKL